MKKALIIIGFMLLTLLVYWYFSGSNLFTSSPRPSSAEPLTFENAEYLKKFGDCPTPEERCLTIVINYPVAKDGSDTIRNAINDYTRELVLRSVMVGDEEPNLEVHLDTAVMDLADSYQDFLEEMPEFGAAWSIEVKGSVEHHSEKAVTLRFDEYSYLGGAHPNSYATFVTFDKSSGRELGWLDVVTDTMALKKMAEVEFRKVRELKPDANLEAEGFWFPNNQFMLPANFGLHNDGLTLFFNNYEVAPYAAGQTEVKLSRAQLGALLKM